MMRKRDSTFSLLPIVKVADCCLWGSNPRKTSVKDRFHLYGEVEANVVPSGSKGVAVPVSRFSSSTMGCLDDGRRSVDGCVVGLHVMAR